MSLFDVIHLIPRGLQREIVDALVDLVSKQAEKLLGDQVADKVKRLRSDAAFVQAFQEGLQRAADRFVREYELEDEDLVAAIAADDGFFDNKQVQEALLMIIKKPGLYLADERGTVLQSFETVLPGRKNRQRVDRAVTFFLRCLAEEVWALPELQPIYSLQFQRMTAEATCQQVELQKAQLQATAHLSADIREALLQLTGVIAQRKPLPSPDATPVTGPPKIYHNLPNPDYGVFIGREEELAQIHRTLRPYPHSQHALVTIDGIGGIGKSALGLEVAHHYLRDYDRLPPEERFDAIIWTSAKSEVLTADGIAPRQQITRTLDDIYTTIAVTLEREDITRARSEEQDGLVTNALTQQRTLLIVDNLETVDDERVNAFLRELPAPTKAIVTTRHRIDVAYPVRLTGMPKKDGEALIAQECAKRDVMLTEAQAENLYDRTGGVPLAIVWSVAQMGYGHDVNAVLRRLGQPSEDIARYCFEGAVEHIRGTNAHRLLMALSLFATNASREALGYVTDLPELDRDDGLVELERLSLINRRQGRFSVLPLTKLYLIREATIMPDFAGGVKSHLSDYFVRLIQQEGGSDYWDTCNKWDYFVRVGEDLENILSVLDWTWEREDWISTLALAKGIIHLLHARGRLEERMIRARQALHAAKEVESTEDLVWFWVDGLGHGETLRGDYKAAQACTSTGLEIAESTKNIAGMALAECRLGSLSIAMQDYEEAEQWVMMALSRIDQIEGRVRASVNQVAGNWFRARQNYVLAEKHFEEALRIHQDIGFSMASSHLQYYRWIGHLRFDQGQYEESKEAFERCAHLAREAQSALNTAHAKYGLALVAEARGDIDRARTLVREAIDLYSRFGARPELNEAELLLNRL